MKRKKMTARRPDTDSRLKGTKRLDRYHPDQLEVLERIKDRGILKEPLSVARKLKEQHTHQFDKDIPKY